MKCPFCDEALSIHHEDEREAYACSGCWGRDADSSIGTFLKGENVSDATFFSLDDLGAYNLAVEEDRLYCCVINGSGGAEYRKVVIEKPVDDLDSNIIRLNEIGKELAALYSESKKLRKRVGEQVEERELGKVTSEEPVKFLMGNKVVSVQRAKMDNDINVTHEELKTI